MICGSHVAKFLFILADTNKMAGTASITRLLKNHYSRVIFKVPKVRSLRST